MAKNQASYSQTEERGIGDNSDDVGGVAGKRLQSFIDRIVRLEDEKKELADDIKDIYAEAKGVGFDAKIMRKQIKRQRMDAEKRQEEDELLDLYESAVENLSSMME
jgi:uncharacterized protein (UPF0335 family)